MYLLCLGIGKLFVPFLLINEVMILAEIFPNLAAQYIVLSGTAFCIYV